MLLKVCNLCEHYIGVPGGCDCETPRPSESDYELSSESDYTDSDSSFNGDEDVSGSDLDDDMYDIDTSDEESREYVSGKVPEMSSDYTDYLDSLITEKM